MSTAASPQTDPEAILNIVQKFVAGARTPVALDPGEEPLVIERDSFRISLQGRTPIIECWSEHRNLVRRIVRISAMNPGRLELEVSRFGGRTGKLLLLDRANPITDIAARHGVRLQYRERFRISLLRQFPGWTLAELSTEADLARSLSPAYTRALMRKGKAAFAAIGAPENGDPDGALSFGLIWLEHLRSREKRCSVEGLAVFVPQGSERVTCRRVCCLDKKAAHYAVFIQNPEGMEAAVNHEDYANVETRLEPFCDPRTIMNPALEKLLSIPGTEWQSRPNGTVSFQVRGLEFARLSEKGLKFGIDSKRTLTSEHEWAEVINLAEAISQRRRAGADHAHPLYQKRPEAWLEWQVRRNLTAVDATLESSPIYTQAPHLAGGQRGIVDLLAIDQHRRLAILELKTKQDIHLPLQALDYWIHVCWHLERSEFATGGYFRGGGIAVQPPRLLLVAPAVEFHSTNQTILNYFSSDVGAERIGLGLEWREEFKVVLRAPQVHGSRSNSAGQTRTQESKS